MRLDLLVVALVLASLLASSPAAEASKKKHKKTTKKKAKKGKNGGPRPNGPGCTPLYYGMGEAECDSQPKGCNVKWVGQCPNGPSGFSGCQTIGDCYRMVCPNACDKVGGGDYSGKQCAWNYNTGVCQKRCFQAVATGGVISGGNTFVSNIATNEDNFEVVCAVGSTSSVALKGDWYFKFNAIGINGDEDAGLVGVTQFIPPMNLSNQFFLNPANPANGYGYRSDGVYLWTYGQGQIGESSFYPDTYTVNDTIGVHLDGTKITFTKNGVLQVVPTDFPALNASFPYIPGVMAHHQGTSWSCIV